MQKKKKAKSPLTAQVFYYVEPAQKAWVKKTAKLFYGSESAYINSLIAKDRGVKPNKGLWKPTK